MQRQKDRIEHNKAYAMGMNFIREKVKENKEILKQLQVAAFIGNLARKYDLTVTVRTQSCVFILGLFNLLPYDAMKTTSINYPFSNLSLSGFEVEIENRGDVGLKKALEGEYDLFILDLMLPEVDGFELK